MKITSSQTFCMLKPDIINRGLIGEVISFLEQDFYIDALEMKNMSLEECEDFYKEHREKFFFKDMVERISANKVVGCILKVKNESKDAVSLLRSIIGATDPKKAQKNTIRSIYGLSLNDNTIHGSISEDEASREEDIFFSS